MRMYCSHCALLDPRVPCHVCDDSREFDGDFGVPDEIEDDDLDLRELPLELEAE